jgi:hypothetical protein
VWDLKFWFWVTDDLFKTTGLKKAVAGTALKVIVPGTGLQSIGSKWFTKKLFPATC